jgi:hypothetical protein
MYILKYVIHPPLAHPRKKTYIGNKKNYDGINIAGKSFLVFYFFAKIFVDKHMSYM